MAKNGPGTYFLLFLGLKYLKTIFWQILVPQMCTPALDKNKIPSHLTNAILVYPQLKYDIAQRL